MDKPSTQAKIYPDGGSGISKIWPKKAVISLFFFKIIAKSLSTVHKFLNYYRNRLLPSLWVV